MDLKGMRLPGWELATAAIAGIAGALVMKPAFYQEAVAEIVTVLGFLMAAFVPAMALAATAIRAGNFSVKTITALGSAVDQQIRLFGGLFLIALAACFVAIGGKLIAWSLPSVSLPEALSGSLDLSTVLPGLLTFLCVFLSLRSAAFIAGVLSILRLSTAVAADEARLRDQPRHAEAENELKGYKMPENYGTLIERQTH